MSSKTEVILNIDIHDINEIELKYNGKCFEFVFRLNEDNHKIILISKKNASFACELYYILENIINNIRNFNIISTAKKIPYIKRFKSGLEKNKRLLKDEAEKK